MANKDKPAKVKKNINFKAKTIGIVELFTVASIGFSTYVVYFGTTGVTPKLLLVPQAVWAVVVLTKKFVK